MKKLELIEKIEELKNELENYQSVAYLDIAEEIENTTDKYLKLKYKLCEADSELDLCIDYLTEALEICEELSEYEYMTTYKKLTSHIQNMILCNKIHELDEEFDALPDVMSNDGEPIGEPMQYYLTDCTESDVEYLCANYDRVYFSYSAKLEIWVLIVDHWGTSWDLVEIGTHNKYDKNVEE